MCGGVMKCFQVRRRTKEINFRYYGGALAIVAVILIVVARR
jgi:hypothetical protein